MAYSAILSTKNRRSAAQAGLVAMAYSRAFFDFQLTFASRLAAKFDLSLADTLYHYTTFTKSFDSGAWADFLAGFTQATDATTWTYEWYCTHHQPDPKPHDPQYDGHPLFGCFYFVVRDACIIRPHFIKNDLPGMRPLSHARVAVRRAELSHMMANTSSRRVRTQWQTKSI